MALQALTRIQREKIFCYHITTYLYSLACTYFPFKPPLWAKQLAIDDLVVYRNVVVVICEIVICYFLRQLFLEMEDWILLSFNSCVSDYD